MRAWASNTPTPEILLPTPPRPPPPQLLVPRLNRLVDKEAEWLAEQEELKQAAQAEETGEADPQQQLEGEAAEHGGAGSPEAAAEPAESVERTQARAAAGGPGAEPEGAVAGAAAGEEGGATDATDGITEADVVAGDGSEQQQQEEGQADSDGQDSSPPYDDGTPDHDAGTAAGEADPEGQDKEPIVSPWSKVQRRCHRRAGLRQGQHAVALRTPRHSGINPHALASCTLAAFAAAMPACWRTGPGWAHLRLCLPLRRRPPRAGDRGAGRGGGRQAGAHAAAGGGDGVAAALDAHRVGG